MRFGSPPSFGIRKNPRFVVSRNDPSGSSPVGTFLELHASESGALLGSGHPDDAEALPPYLGLMRSEDRGRTWRVVSRLGEADLHQIREAHGRLYAFDAVLGAILVSGDGGRTWTEPVPVNRGAAGDGVPQDMPAVAVAPGGRVDVAYYDRTVDPRGSTVDVVLSSSSDGGESFTKHVRLTTQPSSCKVGPQSSPHVEEADFGSRLAVASLAGGAVVACTDTRNGTADTGKQDIFSTSVRLSDNS